MGKYIYFTDEQKLRANSVDLVNFLMMQGETLLPSGKEKRLKSDHSITIHGNEWYDHSTKEGGFAIDFVQNHYGLSFPDAVTMLLTGEQGIPYSKSAKYEEVRKPFELPSRNSDMRRVYAYLTKQRLIDADVISFFAKEKLIYESREQSKDKANEYHNAIFVGFDENGVPRHAHKRGIYAEGNGFKGNIESSNPCYSFHYMGESNRIYIFEAPIDLLSFITMHKHTDWRAHSYLALCGVSEQALMKELELNSKISNVILCLDHDETGIEASEKIKDLMLEQDIKCSILQTLYKDWNEDLKASHNQYAILAEEHPQHIIKNELCKELHTTLNGLDFEDYQYADGETIFAQALIQNEKQAEAMKMASAIFLCLALKVYEQKGIKVTREEIIENLSHQFKTYQNRGRWDPSLSIVRNELIHLKEKYLTHNEVDRTETAKAHEKVAFELLKALVKQEIFNQKHMTSQNHSQRQSCKMAQ